MFSTVVVARDADCQYRVRRLALAQSEHSRSQGDLLIGHPDDRD